MIEIELPWPDAKLSPNARQHWAKHYAAKKRYKRDCFMLAKSVKLLAPDADALAMEVEFYRPRRSHYDADNLLARMKAGIDGVAEALNINDNRFKSISVRVADEVGGYVRLRIFEDTQQ